METRTAPPSAGKIQARLGTLKADLTRIQDRLANTTNPDERARLKAARREALKERGRLKGLLADYAARRRADVRDEP